MKLRHGCARALLGWYFIYPPRADRLDAPITEWHRNSEALKSEADCEAFKQGVLKRSEESPPEHRAEIRKGLSTGLCIQDSDPRFKEVKPPRWHFDSKEDFTVEPAHGPRN